MTAIFPNDRPAPRLGQQLSDRDVHAIRELAQAMRMASWDIAVGCVETAIERGILPPLEHLGTVRQLANLPAFIGGLSTALVRPNAHRRMTAPNPILQRLARDHVIERETLGFTARQIVQEFLLLRRVVWQFVQERSAGLQAPAVLHLEDTLNTVIDEVIAECTVTYFERATNALAEQGKRDGLTGMLNHSAFHARLDEELERCRRYDRQLTVIYFDLDDFKAVNDTLGHPVGDHVLQIVAELVNESVRESDFVGRVGGDEFVIAVVEAGEMPAQLLLERLRARLAKAVVEGRVPRMVGLSGGIASFPNEVESASELLELADRRLYEDKRSRKR